MFNTKVSIFLLFVLTNILVFYSPYSISCSCLVQLPCEALANSTAVFTGKVVDIKVPSTLKNSIESVKVTFKVHRVWKGPLSKTLIITTPFSGATCGYKFKKDQEYLVYAHGFLSELSVSLCSRTQLFSTTDEDMKILGVSILITDDENQDDKSDGKDISSNVPNNIAK